MSISSDAFFVVVGGCPYQPHVVLSVLCSILWAHAIVMCCCCACVQIGMSGLCDCHVFLLCMCAILHSHLRACVHALVFACMAFDLKHMLLLVDLGVDFSFGPDWYTDFPFSLCDVFMLMYVRIRLSITVCSLAQVGCRQKHKIAAKCPQIWSLRLLVQMHHFSSSTDLWGFRRRLGALFGEVQVQGIEGLRPTPPVPS